ncbi:MAG: response regulator transcription factor [Pikeienuella sp.]
MVGQVYNEAQGAAPLGVHFIGDSCAFPDVLLRLMRNEFESVSTRRYADIDQFNAPMEQDEHPNLAIFDERFADRIEESYDAIRKRFPKTTPVLAYRSRDIGRRLFSAQHASGRFEGLRFLPADASIESWVLMMRLLLRGDHVTPCELTVASAPRAAEADDAALDGANLTKRESEVLELVAAGNGNKHIAAELGLSYHTVKLHIHNTFTKIGVRNRAAATHWYLTRRTGGGDASNLI